jgi:hypothetical protein
MKGDTATMTGALAIGSAFHVSTSFNEEMP